MRYGYDALNRIRHIRYGNGVETAYTHDGDGNIRTGNQGRRKCPALLCIPV
ncbi:MAG: hypothetical protein ACLVGL_17275 [Waltera sp.]